MSEIGSTPRFNESELEIGSGPFAPVVPPATPSHGGAAPRRPEEQVPWVSNNGLRVKRRSSHSITLAWSTDSTRNVVAPGFDVSATRLDVPAYPSYPHVPEQENAGRRRLGGPEQEGVTALMSSMAITNLAASSALDPDIPDEGGEAALPLNEAGPYFEVQMKRSRSDEESWQTVYKGYGTRCQVKNLRPDTNLAFRLKTSQDQDWGSQIVASTDIAAPTAEELQRAVDCNALAMVLRIVGTCKPNYLLSIINSVDRKGQSPLMLCASNGNTDMMAILLNAGADVNHQAQNSGKTALMTSAGRGDTDCVRMLTRVGANVLAKDKSGATAIHHAVLGGRAETLELLLKTKPEATDVVDSAGWTPLLRAVAGGSSLGIIRTLLYSGANPNKIDTLNSKSGLMAAVSNARKEAPEIVTALLQHGANPNYLNANGTSVLDMAKASDATELIPIIEDAINGWIQDRENTTNANPLIAKSNQSSMMKALKESASKGPASVELEQQRSFAAAKIPSDEKPHSSKDQAQAPPTPVTKQEDGRGQEANDFANDPVPLKNGSQAATNRKESSAAETDKQSQGTSRLPKEDRSVAASDKTGQLPAQQGKSSPSKSSAVFSKNRSDSSSSDVDPKTGSRRGSKCSAKLLSQPSVDHPMPKLDKIQAKVGSFRSKSKRRLKQLGSSEVSASTEDGSTSSTANMNISCEAAGSDGCPIDNDNPPTSSKKSLDPTAASSKMDDKTSQ